MLKKGLLLQIMSWPEHYLKKKVRVIELIKYELGEKIMKKFVGLRAKTYSYLIYDGSEDKKAKDTRKCVIKKNNLNLKNYLEATQLENKINHLEKKKLM